MKLARYRRPKAACFLSNVSNVEYSPDTNIAKL
jgi:hypothetical protein